MSSTGIICTVNQVVRGKLRQPRSSSSSFAQLISELFVPCGARTFTLNFFGDLTMKKILFASLLAASLLASTTWAQTCPSWPTADRFTLNDDEVTDKRTGLTWKRCSEGQTWSGGTCTGTLTARSHEAALTLANTGQGPTGWRLPNVKELASLADKGCQVPSIDSTAFPATPINWYWASSPDVGSSGKAWCVSFHNGKVSNSLRGGCFHVRLVRSSQ